MTYTDSTVVLQNLITLHHHLLWLQWCKSLWWTIQCFCCIVLLGSFVLLLQVIWHSYNSFIRQKRSSQRWIDLQFYRLCWCQAVCIVYGWKAIRKCRELRRACTQACQNALERLLIQQLQKWVVGWLPCNVCKINLRPTKPIVWNHSLTIYLTKLKPSAERLQLELSCLTWLTSTSKSTHMLYTAVSIESFEWFLRIAALDATFVVTNDTLSRVRWCSDVFCTYPMDLEHFYVCM
jgi:hypothetical protein